MSVTLSTIYIIVISFISREITHHYHTVKETPRCLTNHQRLSVFVALRTDGLQYVKHQNYHDKMFVLFYVSPSLDSFNDWDASCFFQLN